MIIRMRTPVAVTASAIVAILGSTLALIFAAGVIASLFIDTSPRQPELAPTIVFGAALIAASAIFGVLTAVGLLGLRSWARTSILVFAGLTAAASIFGLLMMMSVALPPDISAATRQTFRRTMALMFGIPFAISVWWLIQFNTRSTKAAFASGISGPGSGRPLSISLIAWSSLIGGVTSLVPILTRAPAMFFGVQFNGWAAGVIYAVIAGISIYIGKGLLELDEGARVVGIGWFSFSFVQLAVNLLVPSMRARIMALQRAAIQNQPNANSFNQDMAINVFFGFGAIVTGLCIWFLIRERAAFGQISQK